MDLRTYRSTTMAGALAEVKKDLGPDAVILRTRSFKSGGVLGFGGNSIIEITAAREEHAPRVHTPARRAAPARPDPSRAAPEKTGVRGAGPVSPVAVAPLPPRAGENPAESPVPVRAPEGPRPAAPVTRVELRPVSPAAQATLENELAAIRRMVGQVLQTTRRAAGRIEPIDAHLFSPANRYDPLFDLYETLCDREAPPAMLDELIAEVRDELSPGEQSDASIVRETLIRRLGSRLRVAPPIAPGAPDQGGPLVETLIGPTGVGKTTTIAKLAATHKLRHGRSVGLITADTYRIAAVEQLRTYAGIIGLPLEVALTPEDIAAARERLAGCDVILVDTPGRSPRDRARLEQLGAFLHAARPTRTHLVLSSASSASALRDAFQHFAPSKPDCLVLTKLDEAPTLGIIAHAAETTSLPLSYITTGQEVPDHIEVARSERLARLILGGELTP
jgi:flagellar biosynthesis protein FlhF